MSGATINDLDDVMVGTDQTFKKKKKDMHIQSMARLGLQTSEYFFFFYLKQRFEMRRGLAKFNYKSTLTELVCKGEESERVKDKSYYDTTAFLTPVRKKLKKIRFGDKAPNQKH